MTNRTSLSRRSFLQRSSAGGVAAPYFVSSNALAGPGRVGANDRIGIGWIGAGRRAHQMIADLKGTRSLTGGDYGIYQDYRKMLESKDVDAVVLTTPEHWRALPCIHACQHGKDVYAEKPVSLTIREGRAMVDAVRKYERVCQVGTQQRSYLRNRQATEYIRNGRIGKVHTVVFQNWVSSRPYSDYSLPTERVPEGLDWDMWCGQTEPQRQRTHSLPLRACIVGSFRCI